MLVSNGQRSGPRIAIITTVPGTLLFYESSVRAMLETGAEVGLISSPGRYLADLRERLSVTTYEVAMSRRVSPLSDAVAFGRLFAAIYRFRPELVIAGTPKAGLLGSVAARLARVPASIFHVHGLAELSAKGLRRLFLRTATRLSCRICDRVICVSNSIAEVVIAEGHCRASKVSVPWNGSSSGVDTISQFNPLLISQQRCLRARRRLRIPEESVVIGFAGRLVIDKGLRELADCWRRLESSYPTLHLVIAGTQERHDALPTKVVSFLAQHPRVRMLGMIREMPLFMRMIDVLALPTYREGFPNVVLEAAAMERPTVASRVPGCIDAIVDGMTGTLVEPRDVDALTGGLATYIDDVGLRKRHGVAARSLVSQKFERADVVAAMIDQYHRAMEERDCGATA